jgi:dipeptidyl aminopeptidase/acylaminoacyl peptidase
VQEAQGEDMTMKKTSVLIMIFGLILSLLIHQANAFESRPVNIWSDGTRLSGDLFYPKGLKAGERLPAIILCHGWSGLRAHLNKDYAPVFAEAGYVVLTLQENIGK